MLEFLFLSTLRSLTKKSYLRENFTHVMPSGGSFLSRKSRESTVVVKKGLLLDVIYYLSILTSDGLATELTSITRGRSSVAGLVTILIFFVSFL